KLSGRTSTLSPKSAEPPVVSGILALFQELLPPSFIEQAYAQAEARFHNSVYTPLVVLWLLIWQRLHGAAPLEAAVLDLMQDLPASFWPNPCKRVRLWQESGKPVSGNTAAYNQSRQTIPSPVVEQSSDRIFDQLTLRLAPGRAAESPGAFLLDGSSMRLAYSPALAELFPCGS